MPVTQSHHGLTWQESSADRRLKGDSIPAGDLNKPSPHGNVQLA